MFENRVLGRILRPNMELRGDWRKLHNEELHDLYSSPNIIRVIKSRKMRWVRHVARMGQKINAYRLSAGKPERKSLFGRPKRKWEGVDLINVAQY